MGRPGGGGAPGGFGGQESSTQAITFKEADILSTLPGIYRLDPRLSKRETIQYQNKNSSATIVGTNPAAFADTVGVNISTGRYLNSNDGYSAVVGFNIANQTFDDLDMLNKQLKINGVSFHIVGVLAQSGSGGGFGGSDGSVYIPLSAAKQLFNESTDASQLVVVVSPNHDTDTVASEIDSELLDLHMVTEDTKDFTITTASTMQAAMASVTDTLSLFLAGIASISLLVGGIGVANTMDLPDRLLPRIASRFGSARLPFAPYGPAQLREIVEARLRASGGEQAFEPRAVLYATRKVAAMAAEPLIKLETRPANAVLPRDPPTLLG